MKALLIGDIGGTKVNLAIFTVEDDTLKLESEATFKSANYNSLEEIAEKFLAEAAVTVEKAVFGVAGPVAEGQSKITNLPWTIAETSLQQRLNLRQAKLLNDLEATAYAIPHLKSHELLLLNKEQARKNPHGNMGVIAPGTGLGEALLFYDGARHVVVPSEGGHASFAPTNLQQIELLRYLLQRHAHVSYERVCSGSMGIPNIYQFLSESHATEKNQQVAEAVEAATDPTPLIVKAAMGEDCPLAIATLNMFVTILGTEAGNVAIKLMATGGLYLGGGIPPRILPKLQDGTFMAAYVNKGRFANTVAQIPVYVVLNDKTALWGAAHYGRMMKN